MKVIGKKTCVIAWMRNCRRSIVLAQYFGAETLFLPKSNSRGRIKKVVSTFKKYLVNSFLTIVWVYKNKPEIVIAQAPPIFCPFICLIYTISFKKFLILDCHNAFFENIWPKLLGFRSLLRKANVVVVHNDEYADYLRRFYNLKNIFSLEDKLIDTNKFNLKSPDLDNPNFFLIVSSFSPDEPISEILTSAVSFLKNDPNITFKITGNYKNNEKIYKSFSEVSGIEFLGFVDDNKYFNLMKNAVAVIALSQRDMVQQCASVEALSLEIPLIIHDSPTSRRLFGTAAVYTKIDHDSILSSFNNLIRKRNFYKKEIISQKTKWKVNWEIKAKQLKNMAENNEVTPIF